MLDQTKPQVRAGLGFSPSVKIPLCVRNLDYGHISTLLSMIDIEISLRTGLYQAPYPSKVLLCPYPLATKETRKEGLGFALILGTSTPLVSRNPGFHRLDMHPTPRPSSFPTIRTFHW